MTVSPEMAEALTRFRARPHAGEPVSMERMREHFSPAGSLYDLPDDVAVEEVQTSTIAATWLTPPDAVADEVLFFVHGGAYRVGSTKSHAELAARLGRAAGLRILSIEYRLAPEHPFPAAVDDVIEAWRWLTEDQHVAPARVVVAGDSAGGGLTLALLVALRDAGTRLPCAAVLMSPWTDLSCTGSSMTDRADDDPVLSPAQVRAFAADYLGDTDPRSPLASPLFADLTGLPSLLIQVGTAEILLSDSERLAERADHDGLDVTLEITDGAPHVFQAIRDAPEATAAIARAAGFARHRLQTLPR